MRGLLWAIIVVETIAILGCIYALAPGRRPAPVTATGPAPIAAPPAASGPAFVPATDLAAKVRESLRAGDYPAFAALHDWDAIVAAQPGADRATVAEQYRTLFFEPMRAKYAGATNLNVNPPTAAQVAGGRGPLEIAYETVDDSGMSSARTASCTIRYDPARADLSWRIVGLLQPY